MGLLATNPTGLLASSQTLFDKLIRVFDPTRSRDAKGFPVTDWSGTTPVSSNIPASIQQMSSNEVEIFGKRGIDADYKIFTNADSGAQKGMRIPDPDLSGVYYTVVDNVDMAGRGRFFKIPCKRVK